MTAKNEARGDGELATSLSGQQRMFRKHKMLPHPKRDLLRREGIIPGAQQPPSAALRHQTGRVVGEPPPTPPAHSRTSSSGRLGISSSPTRVVTSLGQEPPATPANQQSPPTPNLTPDQALPTERVQVRPTTDSTTASFETARENASSSDDEHDGDENSTVRAAPPSAKTSQSTVRQMTTTTTTITTTTTKTRTQGLGLGDFVSLEGEWPLLDGHVEQEREDKVYRNVTIRKKRPATNGLRPPAPSITSGSSTSVDGQRWSVMSGKSGASTVVEAILVESQPQRRKTLRHVRKQPVLRDSGSSDASPPSSAPTSVSQQCGAHDGGSRGSTTTMTSIASRRARRDVWKAGGIPVVVIPRRQSSVGSSSKEEASSSLRSTSSHSRRTTSNHLKAAATAYPPRSNDGRWRSQDQRTIDFPPVVPTRSSSLSAPTSRSGSRSQSLTAESLKAHEALEAQGRELNSADGSLLTDVSTDETNRKSETKAGPDTGRQVQHHPGHRPEPVRPGPAVLLTSATSHESPEASYHPKFSVDRDGDPFFGKRLSVQNTPFSQVSVDTNGTSVGEVSEAMAVNIYPHLNRSLMVVNHCNKLANEQQHQHEQQPQPQQTQTPVVSMTKPDGETGPVTPPLQIIDSPLRNPRSPPLPPVINFIPATPSGLTPPVVDEEDEEETQSGHGQYYYETVETRPSRSMSIFRRAFGFRRSSRYGPSSSRTPGLHVAHGLSRSLTSEEMPPADEDRLHPFWRPSSESDLDDCARSPYPPVDNRPRVRRSLSARMKRTFAILPVRDDHAGYCYSDNDDPGRHSTSSFSSQGIVAPAVSHVMRLWSSSSPVSAAGSKTRHFADHDDGRVKRRVSAGALFAGLGSRVNVARRWTERRRERRSHELRQTISGPRDLRDGVRDVIRSGSSHGPAHGRLFT